MFEDNTFEAKAKAGVSAFQISKVSSVRIRVIIKVRIRSYR